MKSCTCRCHCQAGPPPRPGWTPPLHDWSRDGYWLSRDEHVMGRSAFTLSQRIRYLFSFSPDLRRKFLSKAKELLFIFRGWLAQSSACVRSHHLANRNLRDSSDPVCVLHSCGVVPARVGFRTDRWVVGYEEFGGRAQRSRDGLVESCLRRRPVVVIMQDPTPLPWDRGPLHPNLTLSRDGMMWSRDGGRALGQRIPVFLSTPFHDQHTTTPFSVGFVKRGGRAIWDAFMFHAVIKKRGRVPAQDGFIARRTAGPGLASNYFYQVHCTPLALVPLLLSKVTNAPYHIWMLANCLFPANLHCEFAESWQKNALSALSLNHLLPPMWLVFFSLHFVHLKRNFLS